MDNSQVIEPVFRIVAVGPRPERAVLSPARAAAAAKKAVFALLERLGLCKTPRVLCVQCLAADGPAPASEACMGE